MNATTTQVIQLLIAGLTTGSIYAIVAVGFNIIFKSTDAINFAQGEWVMMGGMLAASAYSAWHVPVWAACIGAVLVVGVVGALSERLTIFPVKHLTPILATLITIGVAIFSKSVVMLALGKTPMGYPAFSGDAPVRIGDASIVPQSFWVLGVAATFMIAIHWFFERTIVGKSMRAVAADRDAAALMGINVKRSIMWTFCLAALAGGVAGVIITPITFTSYDHGTMLGFKGFSAAMLGGLGSLQGAFFGGLLLGVVEALAGGLISSKFKDAVSFLLLLLILFARPRGLFGKALITKV